MNLTNNGNKYENKLYRLEKTKHQNQTKKISFSTGKCETWERREAFDRLTRNLE